MNQTRKILIGACLAASLHGVCADEVAKRGGGAGDSEMVLKLQAQVRQIAAERDALQQDVAKLKDGAADGAAAHKKQIAALNERIGVMQQTIDRSTQQNTRMQEGNEALRDRIKDQHEKMQKLVDKYKELVGALRTVEADRTQLNTTVAEQKHKIEICETDNSKLYEAARELLDRYENKGVWDALFEREPVTQLKRVELENVAQDYKRRMDDLRVEATAPSTLK